MRPSVVALGETMVRLALPEHGRIGAGTPLSLWVGGAESNVAIAVARLGVRSTWMGHVGDDDFGSMVIREILGEGVRVIARRDPAAPTGLLVKEHRHGRLPGVRSLRSAVPGHQQLPGPHPRTAGLLPNSPQVTAAPGFDGRRVRNLTRSDRPHRRLNPA